MLQQRREREEATATLEERIADAIPRFSGTMRFVYVHVLVYGFWILANLGLLPGVPKFDPSFVILAMVASRFGRSISLESDWICASTSLSE